ncbi:unnamed protein product [Nezara viridula]|uniref:RNA helicase aquarius n=1 Tax=Nezara viridula TaxID=85310 RepID=A0A9P0HRG7_NEZVI|nr:unnamed protein product [Nezara viridula]
MSAQAATNPKYKPVKPTVDEIKEDHITQLAADYWAPSTVENQKPFDPEIIEVIYQKEIKGTKFNIRRIMMLEVSQYLERYLWPNYITGVSSHNHMMSIVVMMNEKFRERVEAWTSIKKQPEHADGFLRQMFHASLEEDVKLSFLEKKTLILFLTNTFNSIEVELIREQIKRLVSLSSWSCLHQNRRIQELNKAPKWEKYYKKLMKKRKDESENDAEWERKFLYTLMLNFLNHLEEVSADGPIAPEVIHYCERFLEFLIDLEASLPTRRFFNALLDDCQLVLRCRVSALPRREEGHLFSQLLDTLKFYARFEINDITGDPLTDAQMSQMHYDSINFLQKVVFSKYPALREFSLKNVSSIDTRENILKYFSKLDKEALREITAHLNLVPPAEREQEEYWYRTDPLFMIELLAYRHEKRISQLDEINNMPLYPTEEVMWNENIVPSDYYSGEDCLALPKLNLQFLTLHDYLLRNFNLFRLESSYEIRQDIEDAICRLSPWKTEDSENNIYFGGWARMAQPIKSFLVVEVVKPRIGEMVPARVVAEVTINLDVKSDVKKEWESLRKHDICFLIAVQPNLPIGTNYNLRHSFLEQSGLKYIRGCEVLGMLDEEHRIIEDFPDAPKPTFTSNSRTFRVLLDTNQYKMDMDIISEVNDDFYANFNVIVRRKTKENNFKAVLFTIRQLMNSECVVPSWLHDILLGYGDPGAAHYSRMPNEIASLNFNDTFIDLDHLKASFPEYEVLIKDECIKPPFKLTFEDVLAKKEGKKFSKKFISVEHQKYIPKGPYPVTLRRNQIYFTPTQVEAIRAGMQPGLTMVVGPPGTGKTDVAVQIISNLYHNFPNQRILIVTHSNQALNQLFEKIIKLDIEDRHLLRLGHGEEELETDKDFSRYGRINSILSKRLELLEDVQRLQKCLDVQGDMSFSCETARYFYLNYVYASWEKYKDSITSEDGKEVPVDMISEKFPFHDFFKDAPQPLFKKNDYEEDYETALSCFRYIEEIFTLLDEFRAFELLRGGADRSKYLLVKGAKIIAMTCTHAALKRSELVEMGFKYDTILMEESAQILEIETFIPLLVQEAEDGFNRLKRWIMIGDHHQLPPVIKNMCFQKYSNMEQSLFTRFVRLGVPTVDLDAQGRARPGICDLYNWRYKKLGNLSHVENEVEYKLANPGFQFEYQFINVEDFNGVGESEPSPYFYQNLAEAEYIVAVYMYMRVLGYPAEKISILTTYNGQKHLIRDVINVRCASNSLIGKPHKVATVDKYQGQQNDYILLSLVRTKSVGHIRDMRRLVVALSRARLGLYVFGRASLFFNCFELRMPMSQFQRRPLFLHILPHEHYNVQRELITNPSVEPTVITDMVAMANFVYAFYHNLYYQSQMNSQSTSKEAREKNWREPGDMVSELPKFAVSSHPGAGASDSEEDEEES